MAQRANTTIHLQMSARQPPQGLLVSDSDAAVTATKVTSSDAENRNLAANAGEIGGDPPDQLQVFSMRLLNIFRCMSTVNKGIALVSLVAITGLSGCGGGSEPPAVVEVPRQWSAAQLSRVSFSNSAAVSSHADSCGGISAIGSGGNGWIAQRFSPTKGWQPATTIALGSSGGVAAVQRLDVAGVPTVFYRDARNWYRDYFDCARNEWRTVTAFPVEYVAAVTPGDPATPIFVSFSETYEHTALAAWVVSNRDAIALAELRGEVWNFSAPVAAFAFERVDATVPTRAGFLNGVSVVRTKAADVALVSRGLFGDHVAIRTASTVDFQPISYSRGCVAPALYCFTYARYSAPQLELDGSASVLLSASSGTGTNDWFKAGINGLQSLWGNTAPYAQADPLHRVVRADGVAQWLTFNAPTSANSQTLIGDIFEGDAPSSWTNPSSLERTGCSALKCRAFSSPDTSHLVTVMNPGATPSSVPQLAITDRISTRSWAGSYSASLGQLWVDGPNANGSGPAGSGNGTVALVKFHVTEKLQAVMAVLESRRAANFPPELTPFVLWK